MIVHENDLGYFAALKFCFSAAMDSQELEHPFTFAAILELPTGLPARVWLVPLPDRQVASIDELSEALQTTYEQAKEPHATLTTQRGIIHAKTSREAFFGEDMFLLDIELVSVAESSC